MTPQTEAFIDWPAAQRAVEASAGKAVELGVRINVSIVDASGLRLAFLRMRGSSLHSISISEDKAYTAASFGIATSEWAEQLKAHSIEVQQGLRQRPRMVLFGGGIPIRLGGEVVGGIGVSGASEEQDELCARAGLEANGWLGSSPAL